MNFILILTAGGIGKRFGKPYPKQFEKIRDKTIIEHTLGFFETVRPEYCVLTYPEGFEREFDALKERFSFPIFPVKGGSERFFSVKNAVEFINEKERDKSKAVLVHDGVRPFLKQEIVREIVEKTKEKGCAVPYIPVSGTVRRLNDSGFYQTVIRKDLVTVTTPQGARLEILKNCFDKAEKIYTDESTMLTDFGFQPYPVKDWHFNIKITEPSDREIAEILLTCISVN